MTYDDQMIESKQPEPMPTCRNCDHNAHAGPCEHELGDRWVDGERIGAWMAQGPCGCTEYEPITAEDILAAEHPEEI